MFQLAVIPLPARAPSNYVAMLSILGHNNRLVVEINNPPAVRRRLKRQWPSDLPQPDDKN
jgi:hypothetical protein